LKKTIKNPFKGLAPYNTEDRSVFYGREEEIKKLLSSISAFKTLVIYGKSGTGKSSVLRAGLYPRLRELNYDPFDIRIDFHSTLTPSLQIVELIEYDSSLSLERPLNGVYSVIQSLTLITESKGKVPVLVFDQFEEVFVTQNKEYQKSLINDLAQLINKDDSIEFNPKFIFSIREDYLAQLLELTKLIPDLLSNKFRLRPFLKESELLKIILSPGNIDPDIAKLLLSKIPEETSDFSVDTAYQSTIIGYKAVDIPSLQIVLHKLYSEGILQDKARAEEYLREKDDILGAALQEYAISILSSTEPKYFVVLADTLLVRDYRTPIKFEELTEYVPKNLIYDLVKERILRLYDHNEDTFIEISHDALIEPIKEIRNQYNGIPTQKLVRKTIDSEDQKITDLQEKIRKKREKYRYDIAISFAGEDRIIAKELAVKLKENGVSIFFDEFEKSKLFGKNLYDHLSKIYNEESRFCLMLISKHYVKKEWTGLERESAQARALKQKEEYILPVRIDETKVPGLKTTIAYVSLANTATIELVKIIIDKLIE